MNQSECLWRTFSRRVDDQLIKRFYISWHQIENMWHVTDAREENPETFNLLYINSAGWWWEQAQCSEPDVLLDQHHSFTVTMFLSELFYFWLECKTWNMFLCSLLIQVQKKTWKLWLVHETCRLWWEQAQISVSSEQTWLSAVSSSSSRSDLRSASRSCSLFVVGALGRSEISSTSNKERLSAAICSFPKRGLRVKRVRL